MTAPVNTAVPIITGTVAVGNTLSLSDGTWINVPVLPYVYAWLRSGVVIAGETANTYTAALADVAGTLVGRVTATNVDGSASASSAATIAVPTTLIVETGAQVVGANSYLTRVAADAYHSALANIAWAALTVGNREAYLRRATAYMGGVYRMRWRGFRVTATQPLDWPRQGVLVEDGPYGVVVDPLTIPQAVKDAQAELALRAATADLAPDLTRAKATTTVGPISVTYERGSPEHTRYRAIDAMLAVYLSGSAVMSKLVRV